MANPIFFIVCGAATGLRPQVNHYPVLPGQVSLQTGQIPESAASGFMGTSFLCSPIKNIGPVIARRIAKKFEAETLYRRILKSFSPQISVQDNEMETGIFPQEVVIVDHGKLIQIT